MLKVVHKLLFKMIYNALLQQLILSYNTITMEQIMKEAAIFTPRNIDNDKVFLKVILIKGSFLQEGFFQK